jgi:carboxyl-terminal processing protease
LVPRGLDGLDEFGLVGRADGVVDGDAPATAGPEAEVVAGPEAALQHALGLERRHYWSAAIASYEKALEAWPDRAEFRHRLRLCESHYKLGRRYQDPSFRKVLLRLPRDKAIELYR